MVVRIKSDVPKVYGAEMTNPQVGSPAVVTHPMKSLSDLEMVDPDMFTVTKEDNVAVCKDALRIIQERIGDEVPCGMGFPGPFTAASSLLGSEKLLRAIHRQPEELHQLLSRLNVALNLVAEPFYYDFNMTDCETDYSETAVIQAEPITLA